VRILFIGDIVGGPGRRGLAKLLPALRGEFEPDLVIANGENAAGGVGITERTANEIFATGVDLITTGNHVYRHRDAYEFIDRCERLVRPANYPKGTPGRGAAIVAAAGARIGVLNLSGELQLTVARSPFPAAEAELAELKRRGAEILFVDVHAEVTSEKVAMGWHLDGRVAAVVGTHTHVPTADARVLPGGTAFVSDVGMTGARDSILGVAVEDALGRFVTQMPARFRTAEDNVWVNAVVIDAEPGGAATAIEQVLRPAG
jgi:metallophosphoesterase (TIGR00282 family)